MKPLILTLLLAVVCYRVAFSQTYQPRIEPRPCPVKADPRLIVKYGYLVVPENRKRPNGRTVKIPFFFARKPGQAERRNIFLYTTGGPGYSTIGNFDSIGYESGLLKYGGLLLVDQRGTKRAQPCLDCQEVEEAVKRSYEQELNKDSLIQVAVRHCRDRYVGQGIDLSAYTTLESAEDINDLRLALQLDSLNLTGISYSGGLMLTVVRNHPEAVRMLLLNSPLPSYARFEEDGLLNLNEALNQVFADSSDRGKAISLRAQFRHYFTQITGKKFRLAYQKKQTGERIHIVYTKNELLDVISNRLNRDQVKTLPSVLEDLIQGKHASYITQLMDGYFAGDHAVSLGMRYSVYCTEQIAYSDPASILRQETLLPWLAGYAFNDVNPSICACWRVKPEPVQVSKPVYSTVPALITGGDIDPSCRPFYNRLIKRYMPNAQIMTIHQGGHAPGYTVDGVNYATLFLEHPYQPLISASKNVVIE